MSLPQARGIKSGINKVEWRKKGRAEKERKGGTWGEGMGGNI